MQRAVASTPPTAPESQPQNAEHPPSKRQKIGHESSPIATPISVSHSIQNVMDEEELKRVKAIERIAEEAGETKWTLSTVNQDPHDSSPNLRVTMAGYSEIDDGTRTPATHGRRTFGRYQEKEVGSHAVHCNVKRNYITILQHAKLINVIYHCRSLMIKQTSLRRPARKHPMIALTIVEMANIAMNLVVVENPHDLRNRKTLGIAERNKPHESPIRCEPGLSLQVQLRSGAKRR